MNGETKREYKEKIEEREGEKRVVKAVTVKEREKKNNEERVE